MAEIKRETCPMCTQAMAFSSSLNNQLNASIIITKRKSDGMNDYLNFFVSTKAVGDKKAENVGGTAYEINFCPWCGRKLKSETTPTE